MSDCFLHIRREADGFEIAGPAAGMAGHKIQNSGRTVPDGIFAEWAWDGGRLQIRNDRYGFHPIYYFANRDEIAVSTSIVRLLEAGAPRTLDEAGLAAFLRLGFFLGEDTPFLAIRALPPSSVLEWQNGELAVSGQITVMKPSSLSRGAAIDGYISLFRDAIRRRQPSNPNVVVPLSGGHDSRHILLELCRQNSPPDFCVTARAFPTIEVYNEFEVASALCRSLGLSHLTLDQRGSMAQAELNKNLRTGFCSFEHNWYLVVADHLNRTAGAVYDGIGGDVLSAGPFLSEKRVDLCERGRLRELSDDLISVITDQLIENSLCPDLARRLNPEVAFARFETEFRKHLDAPDPVSSFHFWNRTRRSISLCPYGLLRDTREVFSPYLDHEVFDLLASLPARMFLDQTFHTETIQRAYPEFAHFPFSERKDPGGSYRKPYRLYALAAMRYLLRARSHILLRGSYFVPRLMRCLIDRSYLPAAEWIGSFALFLAQLESIIGVSAPPSDLPSSPDAPERSRQARRLAPAAAQSHRKSPDRWRSRRRADSS